MESPIGNQLIPQGRFKSHWADCSHVVAVCKALKDPAGQAPVARLAEILHDAIHSTSGRRTA